MTLPNSKVETLGIPKTLSNGLSKIRFAILKNWFFVEDGLEKNSKWGGQKEDCGRERPEKGSGIGMVKRSNSQGIKEIVWCNLLADDWMLN